jgi:pyruvate/2-oxoglutarate dehydrogenase complex dihydrolipoamide dehydrogenase (E3) component
MEQIYDMIVIGSGPAGYTSSTAATAYGPPRYTMHR